MASAWGNSWSAYWGNSWGAIAVVTPTATPITYWDSMLVGSRKPVGKGKKQKKQELEILLLLLG